MIGDVNDGWAAANTTLQNERAGLGAGGGSGGAGGATPGTVAGQLDLRAGDLVRTAARRRPRPGRPATSGGVDADELARGLGKHTDPTIRQDLVRLHTLTPSARSTASGSRRPEAAGDDIPGMANISKLLMSDVVRLSRDLGLRLLGAVRHAARLHHGAARALDEATGNPMLAIVTGTALYAQAPPIYGGTDQIQRNIIGERVLGLPKEPNNDKTTPFSDLPKNQ